MNRVIDKLKSTWSAAQRGSTWYDKFYIVYVWLWYPVRRRLHLQDNVCELHITLYGKNLTVTLNGSHDEFLIFQEILVNEEYKVSVVDVASIKMIFDVGANIGLVSLYYSALFPKALIHCFEPNPQLYPRLCKQVAQCASVIPHQLALGGTTGPITFYVNEEKSIASSTIERSDMVMKPFTVECQSLDDVLDSLAVDKIDLLQFDIEGAEYDMIQASSSIHRTSYVIGEVHEDLMGHSIAEIINLMPQHTVQFEPGRKTGRYVLSAILLGK